MLLARDSIVGIIIASSISLLASLFTRSIMLHVGENDTYGITGIPSTVGGHRVVQRAGLVASTKVVYPGSGHKDA